MIVQPPRDIVHLGDMTKEEFEHMRVRSAYGPDLMIGSARDGADNKIGVFIETKDKARVDAIRRERFADASAQAAPSR